MSETQNLVTWRVGDVLAAHNLTAYKLAAQLHGKVNRNSVYAIARGDTERVDRATLGHLLSGLEELTGTRYTVADLLEYKPLEWSSDESALLEASAVDLGSQLAELEKDTPADELKTWAAKFGGKSA